MLRIWDTLGYQQWVVETCVSAGLIWCHDQWCNACVELSNCWRPHDTLSIHAVSRCWAPGQTYWPPESVDVPSQWPEAGHHTSVMEWVGEHHQLQDFGVCSVHGWLSEDIYLWAAGEDQRCGAWTRTVNWFHVWCGLVLWIFCATVGCRSDRTSTTSVNPVAMMPYLRHVNVHWNHKCVLCCTFIRCV